MSAPSALVAARNERQQAVKDALKALGDAALKTMTSVDFNSALSQAQDTTKAYWDAVHTADRSARRAGGA